MSEPTIDYAENLCWDILNDGEVPHCARVLHAALMRAYASGLAAGRVEAGGMEGFVVTTTRNDALCDPGSPVMDWEDATAFHLTRASADSALADWGSAYEVRSARLIVGGSNG